jgi:hypothetical protein
LQERARNENIKENNGNQAVKGSGQAVGFEFVVLGLAWVKGLRIESFGSFSGWADGVNQSETIVVKS